MSMSDFRIFWKTAGLKAGGFFILSAFFAATLPAWAGDPSAFNVTSSSNIFSSSTGCEEISDASDVVHEDGSRTRVDRSWTTHPDGSGDFHQTAYHRDAHGQATSETLEQHYDAAGKLVSESWSGSDAIEPPPPGTTPRCEEEPPPKPALAPLPGLVPIPPAADVWEADIHLRSQSQGGCVPPEPSSDPPWITETRGQKDVRLQGRFRRSWISEHGAYKMYAGEGWTVTFSAGGESRGHDNQSSHTDTWTDDGASAPESSDVTLILDTRNQTYILMVLGHDSLKFKHRVRVNVPQVPPVDETQVYPSPVVLLAAGVYREGQKEITGQRTWPLPQYYNELQSWPQKAMELMQKQMAIFGPGNAVTSAAQSNELMHASNAELYRYVRSFDMPALIGEIDPSEVIVIVAMSSHPECSGEGTIHADWHLQKQG